MSDVNLELLKERKFLIWTISSLRFVCVSSTKQDILVRCFFDNVKEIPCITNTGGAGGVLDISLGGDVLVGRSYPDPV